MYLLKPLSLFIALILTVAYFFSHDIPKNRSLELQSRPIVIGAFDQPNNLNPILPSLGIFSLIIDIIFDGLVKLDENMIVKPNLAESWEVSKNGLVWTFHLRKGVTFHDGSPLTADDVKFTLDTIGNPIYTNQFTHILSSIKIIEVVDTYTIKLILRHPFPSLPYYLYFGILPRHIYEGHDLKNTYLNHHPIGAGPYQLNKWIDDELVLKANDSYFLGKPRIRTIIVKIFKNRKAAWAKLIAGKIDLTLLIEPETIQIIKKYPNLKLYSYIHPYYYMIVFNHQKEIFREKTVRQALNYAIDKKWIIENVFGGNGLIVSGLTYPGSVFEAKEYLAYTYDQAKAYKLLKENGWSDNDDDGILEKKGQIFEFTVHVPIEGFYPEKMAFFIQRQLADIGIQVNLKAYTLHEIFENQLKDKRFDAVLRDFVATGDPDINYLFWASSQIREGLNFYNYKKTIIDKLLERGRIATRKSDRIEIYRKFQYEIFKDPPGIFLFWRNINIVIPKSIRGVIVGPGAPFITIHKWYFEADNGTNQ